jgi:hypothetical protein
MKAMVFTGMVAEVGKQAICEAAMIAVLFLNP